MEDVPNVDIVLVCCGGGGLVSGIAAAIKLSGKTDCQVIAVEPKAGKAQVNNVLVV
jgi:threonine dehydratase